ncbi:MAG: peptidoglycan DD-metalloendopeptidase family protein [Actinomycetota bacterium]|nr:peptidoglycan DD-metalloendopeptidase family protein [Actinomycetota bacterium]
MLVPDVPQVADVICLTGCTKLRSTSPGGTVQVTGKSLDSAEAVSFKAAKGRIRARLDSTSPTRLVATVPEGAVTGTVRVVAAGGSASNLSPTVLSIGSAIRAGSKVRVTDASATPAKAFQFGKKKPKLDFIVASGRATADLRIDVVNGKGDIVRSFFRAGVETGSSQSITWAGKVTGGKLAPNGSYRFVIRTQDGSAAALSNNLKRKRTRARTSSKVTDPFGFRIFQYIFPVKGPHTYGDSPGAGRGHQGVDILSRCGLPVRAARAGTVYYNAYQAGGAGNYLVINTKGNGGKSHVYMHLPERSKFKVGAKVKTGQVIGKVGTTGRSTACHLHFEQWSGPGWYQGGTFMDPTAALKRWDRYS